VPARAVLRRRAAATRPAAVLLAVAVAASLTLVARVAAAEPTGWPLRPPVVGPLVRGFEPPATRFGAGHRGADFAASAGEPVTAPAPGLVRFAGRAGGAWWVTVEPRPAVLASVGPLTRVRVRAGQRVGVRSVLGAAAPGHAGAVHLGLRIRGAYTDPLPHLTRPARPRLVRLAGAAARPTVTRLPDPPAAPARGALATPVAPARPDAAAGKRRTGARQAPMVGRLAAVGGALAGRLGGAGPRLLGAVGAGAAWARGCLARARPAALPPNGNLVVGLAGMTTSSELARELDLTGLGYRPEDVLHFSYRACRTPAPPQPRAWTRTAWRPRTARRTPWARCGLPPSGSTTSSPRCTPGGLAGPWTWSRTASAAWSRPTTWAGCTTLPTRCCRASTMSSPWPRRTGAPTLPPP
jgi:Peptidase family M23